MKRILYLLLIVVISSSWCDAQSRKDLEKKRRSLSSQISKATKLLKKTSSNKRANLKRLTALQKKIGSREEFILIASGDVDSINVMLDRKIGVVVALENDLSKLKENYKKLIRRLYRYKLGQQVVSFVLSSSSFTEAYQRFIYLQRLKSLRHTQAELIQKTQNDLAQRVNMLEGHKATKNTLLQNEIEQKELLADALQHKDKLVTQLKKQEGRLRSDLKRKTRYRNNLSKKIEKVIIQQIAADKLAARQYKKAQAEKREKKALEDLARRNKPSNQNKTSPLLKSMRSRSNSEKAFAHQKGKLMSPIYLGRVVGKYGKSMHPEFKEVIVNNNGIDIKGQYNSVIRNVYEGEVISVFSLPSLNNVVMVKHGDYYTTYSNVANVYVKKGERLRTGGQIGTIGRDPNRGGHSMHFEIWFNKSKLNPSSWIKK